MNIKFIHHIITIKQSTNMEYLLSVHPDKDERVLQLLESLEALGIIESFALQSDTGDEVRSFGVSLGDKDVQEYDIAEQYRNMVD